MSFRTPIGFLPSKLLLSLGLLLIFTLGGVGTFAQQSQPATSDPTLYIQQVVNGVTYDNIIVDDLTLFTVPTDAFGNPAVDQSGNSVTYSGTPEVAGEYLDMFVIRPDEPRVANAASLPWRNLPIMIYAVFEVDNGTPDQNPAPPGSPLDLVQDRINGFIRLMVCGDPQCNTRATVDILEDRAVGLASPDGVADELYDVTMDFNSDGRPVIVYRNETTNQLRILECQSAGGGAGVQGLADDICGDATNRATVFVGQDTTNYNGNGVTPAMVVGDMYRGPNADAALAGFGEATLISFQDRDGDFGASSGESYFTYQCALDVGTSTVPSCVRISEYGSLPSDFRPYGSIDFVNTPESITKSYTTFVEAYNPSPSTNFILKYEIVQDVAQRTASPKTTSDLDGSGSSVSPPWRTGFFSDVRFVDIDGSGDDEIFVAYRAIRNADDATYNIFGDPYNSDNIVNASGLFVITCGAPLDQLPLCDNQNTDRNLVTKGAGRTAMSGLPEDRIGGAGSEPSVAFDVNRGGLPVISYSNSYTRDLGVVFCENFSCTDLLYDQAGTVDDPESLDTASDANGFAVADDGEVLLVSDWVAEMSGGDDLGRSNKLQLVDIDVSGETRTGLVISHYNRTQARVELYRPEVDPVNSPNSVGAPIRVDISVNELDSSPGLVAGEFFNLELSFDGSADGIRVDFDPSVLSATALRQTASAQNASIGSGQIDGLSSADTATIRMRVEAGGVSAVNVVDAAGNVVASVDIAAAAAVPVPVGERGSADGLSSPNTIDGTDNPATDATPNAPVPVGGR